MIFSKALLRVFVMVEVFAIVFGFHGIKVIVFVINNYAMYLSPSLIKYGSARYNKLNFLCIIYNV